MSISLKELKKNRLTPTEKWVLERIEGAEPRTLENDNVVWCKDGKLLFKQYLKYGFLSVSWTHIRGVLDKDFGLNDNEIIELLTNLLYDYTNNGKFKIKIYYVKLYETKI